MYGLGCVESLNLRSCFEGLVCFPKGDFQDVKWVSMTIMTITSFFVFSFSYDVSFETFLSGDNVFHGLYISSHSWASLTGSQRKPLCNLLQSRNFTQFVRTSSKRPLQNMNISLIDFSFPSS